MDKVNDLVKQRATAFDLFEALADKPTLTPEEQTDYAARKKAVEDLDGQIVRAKESVILAGAAAQPVADQDPSPTRRVYPSVESDPYKSRAVAEQRGFGTNSGLVVGGICRMLGQSSRTYQPLDQVARAQYGEDHPVTHLARALIVSQGTAGGFIVPPDYMNEIIELLRPATVVRSSGPRVIPMPRGTMTLPGEASPATAQYGSETAAITASQQTLNQIVASYKKLTALVPVSNDMMRYADPAVDAFVRDDLVKVLALREDLAFLFGDGTQDSPRGFTSFANGWAVSQGGTAGTWSSTANSTAGVNSLTTSNPLIGSNGGNFITSNETYTLATASAELGGLQNKLDSANVADNRRIWFMHPRTKNYLYWAQNSLGEYVFRSEIEKNTLSGYPLKTSTQVPVNIWDATGTNKDCSFIILAEITEAMILDSMSLELAVSREGSYVSASGSTISAFQNDQTLIRAIEEHDFQMRHDSAVAVAQFVRWAPQLS